MAKISEKKSVALVEPKEDNDIIELGQNKSELIQSMTEKQKTETLLILSGDKKGTPQRKGYVNSLKVKQIVQE